MGQSLWEALETLGGFGSSGLAEVGILPLFVVLAISLASSLFISYLYVVFYGSRSSGSDVHRAFPLIGIAITAIFVSVQFSLPLSLGLLGALSIVRFRTPIKEPEEIGFILLVIATSLSAATFNPMFLGMVLVVAVAAMVILQLATGRFLTRGTGGMFTFTLPSVEYRAKFAELQAFLSETIPSGRIDSLSESDGVSTISYSFLRFDEDQLPALANGLEAIAAGSESHVYFNRTGGL